MSERAVTESAVGDEVFRAAMGALAGGVAVVTTVDANGEPRGLTTTAVTSVSLRPPLVLVCLDRGSRTLLALRDSKRFAVNVLDAGAADLARTFASRGDDKFAALEWRLGRNGCPLLHLDSLAWAECRTELEVDAGDHVILVGRVADAEASAADRRPLTYFRGRFGHWSQSPLEHSPVKPTLTESQGDTIAK